MKNSQKGSASVIIIIVLVFVIVIGGYYLYSRNNIPKNAGLADLSQSQSPSVSQTNIQPKAPTGYLTPESSSMPAGYTYVNDYGSSSTTIVFIYKNANLGQITFAQMPGSYSEYLSYFVDRAIQPEKIVKKINTGAVLEGLSSDGVHDSYRLIYNYNNSGKILQIYAKNDANITPEILIDLLQQMQ
jgi:hypothetical protein